MKLARQLSLRFTFAVGSLKSVFLSHVKNTRHFVVHACLDPASVLQDNITTTCNKQIERLFFSCTACSEIGLCDCFHALVARINDKLPCLSLGLHLCECKSFIHNNLTACLWMQIPTGDLGSHKKTHNRLEEIKKFRLIYSCGRCLTYIYILLFSISLILNPPEMW